MYWPCVSVGYLSIPTDCAINYFREAGMCKLCPANSVRDSTAATVCTCGRDYARASNDKCVRK